MEGHPSLADGLHVAGDEAAGGGQERVLAGAEIAARPVHNRSFHVHPGRILGDELSDEAVPDRNLGLFLRIEVPGVDSGIDQAQGAVAQGKNLIVIGKPVGQARDRRRLRKMETDHHPVLRGDSGS